MKIAGIIAEYNPFHRGHAHHIESTRRLTGCDGVVVCMAGHFTQRGEPTPWSKWARARMALACGADAVFELPALFTVRTADAFARGGVGILGALGCDVLSFGSETADMALLRSLAALRAEEPEGLSQRVREKLDAGMSHARARGEAVAEALDLPFEAVNRPNMILAAEYLRAVEAGGFDMACAAVPRQGDYHDDETLSGLASGSAIRAAVERGEIAAALAALPEAARPFAVPDDMHPMDDMLLYRLRGMDPGALSRLPDVGEGLEHRLFEACREASSREALLGALKCKRYTRARLSRLLAHALIGMDADLTAAHPAPTWARLLGARGGAEPLLAELKSRSRLPIVSRAAELKGDPIFDLECRATDVWALLHDRPDERRAGREFRERFVREGGI